MDSVSSQALAEAEADDVQKSAQATEVNPEKADQASAKAQKAEKPATKDDAETAWVAAASVPVGLEPGKVAALPQVVDALNKQVDDFPHVFVVGDSGAGKTTLVQLLVGTRPGDVVILDPKRPKGWEGAKWGGLPYVSRDKESGSYTPMVNALKAVVKEMNRRYRVQDEVSEPFQTLTVVLDEAKNSVQECEELATLYKKIVSIGREVGIRLVLISTSDRAGVLGFSGEADSMDSFAWVQLGEFALRQRAELKERGKERYYWAVADMFGQWMPFENEKAFKLLGTLNLGRNKAWQGGVEYNCQATVKASDAEVPLWVGFSSNVMCSWICTSSECRKPSMSSPASARSSRANWAIAGLTSVSAVGRRNRPTGNRSSVPRSTPPVSCVSIRPSTWMVSSSRGPVVSTWVTLPNASSCTSRRESVETSICHSATYWPS